MSKIFSGTVGPSKLSLSALGTNRVRASHSGAAWSCFLKAVISLDGDALSRAPSSPLKKVVIEIQNSGAWTGFV